MTPTILCVDDEKIVLDSLKAQLNSYFNHEYFIEIAESGEEALEVIEEMLEDNGCAPNVLISDQLMPGMKGDELLAQVKLEHPEVCTILLTGQAQKEDIIKAINYGKLYRYIPKPWDTQDLNLTVKEALTSTLLNLKLEEQNLQLIELNKTLEEKVLTRTKELSSKNDEIESSLKYAKRIQTALLPSKRRLNNLFKEHFTIYKPLHEVSGDFYWAREKGDKIYFALGDCTGHGVPGAMLSMLAMELLTSCITHYDLSVGELMSQLHAITVRELNQTSEEIADGMDACLICYDKTNSKLTYAGAGIGPMITNTEKEITCLPYNRLSIGGLIGHSHRFETREIDIKEGDTIYISSDGFKDQFGGAKNKKFSSRRLKQIFEDNKTKNLADQKISLEKALEDWKGEYPQIDDISVIAVKLK